MREAEEPSSAVAASNDGARDAATVVILVLLSLLLFFPYLGSLPLFDADEPAFAEAAREMLLSGDWITPHFNFQPRFDKPILIYWLIGLAYKAFGVGEFAARFWSATFATALVLSIYLFCRRVIGSRGALIAALAFATNVGTAILARAAVTDMTLTFFVTWSLFCFLAAHRAPDPQRQRLLLLAYLAMALSVLTKGPIGLLIPFLVVGLFLMIRGRAGGSVSRLVTFSGLAVFSVVALPWYVMAFRDNGWDFIQGFIVKHHLVRYTGVISGHRGPIYYFLPVVLLGFFPWSAMLPKAFGELWRERTRLREALTMREELVVFAWIWFAVVFVFFSFSGTKLPSYIFPAFPALSLLSGASGEALLFSEGRAGHRGSAFDWLLGGIGCLVATGLFLFPLIAEEIRLAMAPDITPFRLGLSPYALGILFVLGPAVAVLARRSGRGDLSLAAMAAGMVLSVLFALHQLVPTVQANLQDGLLGYADTARRVLGPGDLLVAYDFNAPSLVFYSRRQVVSVGKGQEVKLAALAASTRRLLIVSKSAAEDRLRGIQDIFPLDRRGGYVLYSSGWTR